MPFVPLRVVRCLVTRNTFLSRAVCRQHAKKQIRSWGLVLTVHFTGARFTRQCVFHLTIIAPPSPRWLGWGWGCPLGAAGGWTRAGERRRGRALRCFAVFMQFCGEPLRLCGVVWCVVWCGVWCIVWCGAQQCGLTCQMTPPHTHTLLRFSYTHLHCLCFPVLQMAGTQSRLEGLGVWVRVGRWTTPSTCSGERGVKPDCGQQSEGVCAAFDGVTGPEAPCSCLIAPPPIRCV